MSDAHPVRIAPMTALHGGRGIGRTRLHALIASTEAAGIWTIQAGIFPENTAGLALHHRCGFRDIGVRERVGKHHGVWRRHPHRTPQPHHHLTPEEQPAVPDTPATTDKPSVLFVCVHNAGRSQMAAGWLRHLAGDRVEVRSAGSAPAETINLAAAEAMREVGIDITDQTPKLLEYDTVEATDVIITMGCGDACPVFPGKRYEDWKLVDPAGKGVEAVRPIRDDIRARIEALLAELVPAR